MTSFVRNSYGEHVEGGFDFKLFDKKEGADEAANVFLEGEQIPYEVVEVCFEITS